MNRSGEGSKKIGDQNTARRQLDPTAYLQRIGVDSIDAPDLATLACLQREHIRTVPFENLAIAADPANRLPQDGVQLSLDALYTKIVGNRRGGYCFELNGLFAWLLSELGYDVTRVAARIVSDGDPGVPANHHSIIVELDRRYVVDVGLGSPKLPRPLPLDGTTVEGPVVEWRAVDADRPDEDVRVEVRKDQEWTSRYVFTDTSRSLRYFRATNDYLQTAPESPFTGEPYLSILTADGFISCTGQTLRRVEGTKRTEQTIPTEEWYDHLYKTFNIQLRT